MKKQKMVRSSRYTFTELEKSLNDGWRVILSNSMTGDYVEYILEKDIEDGEN